MNLFDQSVFKRRTTEGFTLTVGAPLTVGSRASRSSATAVQTSRSEDREATLSSSEEQRGFSVVGNVVCLARSVASSRSLTLKVSLESVSVIWEAGLVRPSWTRKFVSCLASIRVRRRQAH